MFDKSDNRKLILQQLLQKSQLFNTYFGNTQNINTIMNFSPGKRNQLVRFGKCQINLPQRIKPVSQKFTSNKIMILTKNKKQASRLKQKYDHLFKLKQSQNIKLNLNGPRSQRNMADIIENEQCKITPQKNQATEYSQRKQTLQRYNTSQQENNDQHGRYCSDNEISQHQAKQFIMKNRVFSAKVRPQFDLFLKYKADTMVKHRSSMQEKSNTQQKIQSLYESTTKNIQEDNLIPSPETPFQKQYDPTINRTPVSISMHQQDIITALQSRHHQKRSSTFSIKKTPTSIPKTLVVNKNYQQKIQEDKKHKINFRRELHKTYNRTFIPPPKITAQAYTIYQMKQQGNQQSGKILATINGKNSQEIASLTKIMTCIIILQLSQNYSLSLGEQTVQIGRFQISITGTSARLKQGQIYTVHQLLYGLMLPSGNDASLALGVWGGKRLMQIGDKNKTQQATNCSETSSPALQKFFKKYYKKDYVNRFVEQMNIKAQSLGMTRTRYANTHGLVNNENKSSAIDIALLSEYVMNNKRFAKIVSTKCFTSTIQYIQQNSNNQTQQIDQDGNITRLKKDLVIKHKQIKYINTHYLLQKRSHQYIGIKTGVTTAAGPCLSSCIHHRQSNRKFIIVVLDCKTMMMRFKDTQILKKWIYKQENLPTRTKKTNTNIKTLREGGLSVYSETQEEQLNSQYGDFEEEKNCQD